MKQKLYYAALPLDATLRVHVVPLSVCQSVRHCCANC